MSILVLLAFILFLSNTVFSDLNRLLEQQNLYANYRVLASELQDQVTNYLYQSEEIESDSLKEQAQALLEVSASITEAFYHAQLLDHQKLNQAYVSAVCDLADVSADESQEILFAYQNTQHLYELTVAQYDTTLSGEQQILYSRMAKISSHWYKFEFLVTAAFFLYF